MTHPHFTTKHFDNLEYIQNTLPLPVLLDQLSEECAELIQAAHKLNRAMGNGNPTPVSEKEARDNLLEEIADVIFLLPLVGLGEDDMSAIVENMSKKAERWVGRLKEWEEWEVRQ